MKFSLAPRSLFGRLLAALLAVVGAMMLVTIVLIVRERRELILWSSGADNLTQIIVAQVRDFEKLDAPGRASFLAAHAATDDAPPRGDRPEREFERAPLGREFGRGLRGEFRNDMQAEHDLVAALRKELGARYDVETSPPRYAPTQVIWLMSNRTPGAERPVRGPQAMGRPLDIRIRLPSAETLIFRAETPRAPPPFPTRILIQLGITAAALAMVLYWTTRSIVKPLSELARSADAFGRGEQIQALEERGAKELRHATRAFNTMHERLRRYLDSRTQVLAAMSHDLRTPITRLKLRAETIEDETLRARFVADLDEMTHMVQGALRLFRGLNDRETFEAVNIDALLAALQVEFRELGHDVVIEGSATQPLTARPQALKRCLTNLIDNAFKYGGSATICVEDNEELIVRIRDNGPGVPPQQLDQVFEPFFRLESSRSRDTGGTGLGLSIARDIAQAHGGSLTLRNRAAGGLEATLTLPRSID